MLGIGQCITPGNVIGVDMDSMDEEIHSGHGPGRTIHFLAVDRNLIQITSLTSSTNQQRSRATGGIVNRVTSPGGGQHTHQFRNHARSKETARLFAGFSGKFADHVFIGITDYICRIFTGANFNLGRLQAQRLKIFQKRTQLGYLLLRITQHGFAVEIDAAEHTSQFGVAVLDALQGSIDHFTDFGIKSILVKIIKSFLLPQDKWQILFGPFNADLVTLVPFLQISEELLVGVIQIFQEQHG